MTTPQTLKGFRDFLPITTIFDKSGNGWYYLATKTPRFNAS